MYRLCCERDARGEAIHDLTVFGVALDGRSVQLLRMTSGAPLPGCSFAAATPCPVQRSPILPLLPWDWMGEAPPEPPPAPSLGFCALSALLCIASAASAAEAPLEVLRAALQLQDQGDAPVVAAGDAPLTTLRLSLRLGRGGSSDVYAASAEPGGAARGAGSALVVKLPRWSSKAVEFNFERERSALVAARAHAAAGADAAAAASLPQCLAHGWLPILRGARAAPWPLLVLQPLGVPLAEWVAQRCGGHAGAALLRMQCATQAAAGCARALRAAHAAGWVHCDLRPSNIVVRSETGSAVLVDWGSAQRAGEDCLGEGVAVFAHERMRGSSSCRAHDGLDACALLLTWVAIAWHERCEAPWGDRLPGLFDDRWQWLEDGAKVHEELGVVLEGLRAIDVALRGGAPRAGQALGAAEAALGKLLAMHGALPPVQPAEREKPLLWPG